jgi:protein-S-isoprenylcysteine O-methyltransferase Ste14
MIRGTDDWCREADAEKGAANVGIVRPPMIYFSAILVGLLLTAVRSVRVVPRALHVPLGSILVMIACMLFVWAVRTFRSVGTPVPGNRPTTAIVHTGPYRWSRNPIYLSFSLFQIGIAMWVNSVWLLATLVPAAALMSAVVIPREERFLERRFPDTYPAYKTSVRRWL